MPELPEVETTRRGIAPHIVGAEIQDVIVRQRNLRWPIPLQLKRLLRGRIIQQVNRRAKYLLLKCENGTLILHLGMSGSLRVLPADTPTEPHDHFDLVFKKQILRLRDPRRFGAVLWSKKPIAEHKLLSHLGPEPLSSAFDGDWLFEQSHKCKSAVKNFIMNGRIVVGVGNIYASESLFMAGIHPQRAANRISRDRYRRLAGSIKQVLAQAIEQGGTTLRDFQNADGNPGYFDQQLQVYGRQGAPCPQCKKTVTRKIIGQRASYYCSHCQR